VVVGHSFGGQIVFSSLDQSLIEDVKHIYRAETMDDSKQYVASNLTILINPAIEATRYDGLHRVASAHPFHAYHTPVFVSITSTDDLATRYAFPIGRSVSTAFHRYVDKRQRSADLSTMGHDEQYVDFELNTVAFYNKYVVTAGGPDVMNGAKIDLCAAYSRDYDMYNKLLVEAKNLDKNWFTYFRAHVEPAFPRLFCVGDQNQSISPGQNNIALFPYRWLSSGENKKKDAFSSKNYHSPV
jgi:hypothetical protein